MMTREIYSDLPIPPGNFLEEVLDDMGMGKDELAKRMNRPPAKLSQIFNGQKSITPETALQLERVTGVPAHIWTGLETEYRLTLARLQEEKEQESRKKEVQLVTKYYYKELVKLGLVESKTNPVEKVVELQKYFGITSLLNLDGIRRYQILYRQANSKKNKVSPEALTAWLRMGEIKAYKIDCLPYSEKKLIQIIPEIRSMTLKTPREYQIVLEAMLASCGIALVIVPHLPKTCAHGAAFWLSKDKAVIMLTIRGSWADIFWFSLFHEIAHIILHGKQEVFIEGNNLDFIMNKLEDDANEFARDQLISPREYKIFVSGNSFYKEEINVFARKIGVHPGIVVGRLHHDKLIEPSWHNDLRERYEWSEIK